MPSHRYRSQEGTEPAVVFTQGTDANREGLSWTPSSVGLISTPTNPNQESIGEDSFQDKNPCYPPQSSPPSVHRRVSLQLSATQVLPPGEEGFSALETLRVGFTVCSLGRSSRFNDDRGHLDQLEGGFTILYGLGQVQDLRRVKQGGQLQFVRIITWISGSADSPGPAWQIVVYETVPCQNQDLSVTHSVFHACYFHRDWSLTVLTTHS